jgi:hypothetical protein
MKNMKKFLSKLGIMFLIFFICVEFISRLLIDPIYFYSINTYNLKGNKSIHDIFNNDTKHVDYLFIGSSRVPATINADIIMEHENDKVAIVAGRGYTGAGMHYQALQNKLSNHPDYLKDACVFIEYAGSGTYTENFKEDKLRVYEPVDDTDKPMPHLLIPHLTIKSLFTFLKESKNSNSVKREMILLYVFSFYRTSEFIKEKYHRLTTPIFTKNESKLVSEGGIRNDNIDIAKQRAVSIAQIRKKEIENDPPITFSALDSSSLSKFHELITNNGGKLILFEMPLHSLQKDIYSSEKAKENKKTFEQWISARNIPVIYTDEFECQDSDFPDTWHLGKDRRDEFTNLLYSKLINSQLSKNKASTENTEIL